MRRRPNEQATLPLDNPLKARVVGRLEFVDNQWQVAGGVFPWFGIEDADWNFRVGHAVVSG